MTTALDSAPHGPSLPAPVTPTTVALVTLGAQLAVKPRWPRWRPVSVVLFVRLLWAPVQMAAPCRLHKTLRATKSRNLPKFDSN